MFKWDPTLFLFKILFCKNFKIAFLKVLSFGTSKETFEWTDMQRWETLCNLFTCSTSSNIKRLNQIKRLKPFYKRIRSFEINLNLSHSNPWDLRCIKQALYKTTFEFSFGFRTNFFLNLFSLNLISSSIWHRKQSNYSNTEKDIKNFAFQLCNFGLSFSVRKKT